MISTNFTELNDSMKTFILSVAVGPDVVIEKLLATVNRHLNQLELIQIDTPNAKLYFECSVRIIANAHTSLCYINHHSADVLSDDPQNPLDVEIEAIEKRFNLALNRIKKEVPNVR